MAVQDLYNKLTDEQKKRFRDCKTQEDFLRVVQEEGIELTDDQLEAISGGSALSDWADQLEDTDPS